MKKSRMKIAHTFQLFVCECGCGSVNMVLEDGRGELFAAAQLKPEQILDSFVKIANEALQDAKPALLS